MLPDSDTTAVIVTSPLSEGLAFFVEGMTYLHMFRVINSSSDTLFVCLTNSDFTTG